VHRRRITITIIIPGGAAMFLARLILLTVCGLAPEPEPARLVEALSSPHKAERDEAAGLLEEMGRKALPALRGAREPQDQAVRDRIALLIDLIERQRLLRATRIMLDFRDRPLSEVVAAVAADSSHAVLLEPVDDPGWKLRRITLIDPKPVGFWEALDRIGAVAGLRHNPGIRRDTGRRMPPIPLIARTGDPVPASYAGPFRVNLVDVSRHRQVSLSRGADARVVPEEFSVLIHVFAEPGLAMAQIGPLQLVEAADDRDRDLRPTEPGPPFRRSYGSRRFDKGDLDILQFRIPLKLPDQPGLRIRRLRGFVPVMVAARTDSLLIVPLEGAQGKSFTGGGLTVTVTELQRQEKATSLRVAVRGEGRGSHPFFDPLPHPAPLESFRPPFRIEDHLQILDAQGRVFWWNPSPPPQPGPSEPWDVRIVLDTQRLGPPAELRCYGVVGALTEVAFEFADIPMP
jgi:hypothetical protein